jgi:hypothetical protein
LALLLLLPLLILLLLTAEEKSSLRLLLLRPPVPDRETGSCLDPRFAGRGKKSPASLALVKRVQLEPSRDVETMRRDKEEPIPDVMKEDQ